jgi:endonuclease/exonuclease/phosphatase family metal-dependent hydrolase
MSLRALCLSLVAVTLVPAARGRDFIFAAYNLENYFTASRASDPTAGAPKSDASIAALVRILSSLKADALGLSEIGAPEDLEDLRQRLRSGGLDYPHAEFVKAAEGERNLALLSRLPIAARQSVTDLTYEMEGTRQRVRRGFLDVTLEPAPGVTLRLVGAHLKSRLTRNSANEALARRSEAALLRRHVDHILAANPGGSLVVWGDFNDVKSSATIAEIIGTKGTALIDLAPADRQGDRWTWHDAVNDSYQRVDFLFVSRALRPAVVASRTRVHRAPDWRVASDHRAMVVAFRWPKGPR